MRIDTFPHIFLFAFVGSVGFVVDAAIFALLFELMEITAFEARIIAFICAATTTWAGNRVLTFRHRVQTSRLTQWKKFMVASCFSALPNLLVFKVTLELLAKTQFAPYLALIFGVLAGMISNYALSSHWVFATKKDVQPEI